MKNNNDKNKEIKDNDKEKTIEFPDRDHPQKYHAPEAGSAINNPTRALPAFNPPVPNKAWTEMRQDLSVGNQINTLSNLTPEELSDIHHRPKLH